MVIKMANGKFNSEQISIKVKEYFEKVRGMKAYLFGVDSCNYEEPTGLWIVVCHFISNIFEGREDSYIVKVDGKTGDIVAVSKFIRKI